MDVQKEAVVAVLDIGKPSHYGFACYAVVDKQESFMKSMFYRKIFSCKQDTIGVVSCGSQETRNKQGYEHIIDNLPVAVPDWDMAYKLENCLTYQGYEADFLQALSLAVNNLKKIKEMEKFDSHKIILFSALGMPADESNLSSVAKEIKSANIELIIIADKVAKSGNSDDLTGSPNSVFEQSDEKSDNRKKNEVLAFQLIKETNGTIFGTDSEIVTKRNPSTEDSDDKTTWDSTFSIGSHLSFSTRITISSGEEPAKKWTSDGSSKRKEIESLECGQVDAEKCELLESLVSGRKEVKAAEALPSEVKSSEIHLVGLAFIRKMFILEEFFIKDDVHSIVLLKDDAANTEFDALVKAIAKSNAVMIAERFVGNANLPVLVALKPAMRETKLCLEIYELSFGKPYLYWFCPILRLRKYDSMEPPKVQDGISELKEAMDYVKELDSKVTSAKGTFPKKSVLGITLEYLHDKITGEIADRDDPDKTLEQLLGEAKVSIRKFGDELKKAITSVKDYLKLQDMRMPDKLAEYKRLREIPTKAVLDDDHSSLPDIPSVYNLTEIGTVSPAEDCNILVDREEDFESVSLQMQKILSDIFNTQAEEIDNDKLIITFIVYREQAVFNGADYYNEWMLDFKTKIIEKRMFDFWENIIVGYDLGLIHVEISDMTELTAEEAETFYQI